MSINVEGSFFCAREAAKDMMRREAPGVSDPFAELEALFLLRQADLELRHSPSS